MQGGISTPPSRQYHPQPPAVSSSFIYISSLCYSLIFLHFYFLSLLFCFFFNFLFLSFSHSWRLFLFLFLVLLILIPSLLLFFSSFFLSLYKTKSPSSFFSESSSSSFKSFSSSSFFTFFSPLPKTHDLPLPFFSLCTYLTNVSSLSRYRACVSYVFSCHTHQPLSGRDGWYTVSYKQYQEEEGFLIFSI